MSGRRGGDGTMRRVAHAFVAADLIGGDPALDLVNTVTGRDDDEPRDWLADYGALLDWAGLAEVVSEADLARLAALARRDGSLAEAALVRARDLREALVAALTALIAGRAPRRADLEALDAARQAAASAGRLVAGDGGVALGWSVDGSGLDLVTHVVTGHALALLADPSPGRLRVCDGSSCGWLFLDVSKSGRRRWCDMATCGNVAKARRHHARQR